MGLVNMRALTSIGSCLFNFVGRFILGLVERASCMPAWEGSAVVVGVLSRYIFLAKCYYRPTYFKKEVFPQAFLFGVLLLVEIFIISLDID